MRQGSEVPFLRTLLFPTPSAAILANSYQFLGSGTTRNSGQYLSNNRCGLKNAFRNILDMVRG